jgi:hypothetical protein
MCGNSFIPTEQSTIASIECPHYRQIRLSNMPFCGNCGTRLQVREVQPRTYIAIPVDRKDKLSVLQKILIILALCVITAGFLYALFIVIMILFYYLLRQQQLILNTSLEFFAMRYRSSISLFWIDHKKTSQTQDGSVTFLYW